MFVRCSNCQTQFSLDDRQVGADGVAVRCAVCRYVFRVDPPDGTTQAWRVRTVDGDLFEAEDLPTLRVWVREGRLHPDDTISRTGKHWIRLGDMPEFSDAFAGFPDLPEVLSAPEGTPLELQGTGAVGPPPSYGGDEDVPTEVADAVRPVSRDHSEQLDMSGLFSVPHMEDGEPDDTVVRAPNPEPSDDADDPDETIGAPSKDSSYEDSASMVLDDLVVSAPSELEPVTEVVADSGEPRRKPKHRTRKLESLPVEAEAEAEAEADAVQARLTTRDRESPRRSMLGNVTAHVKSESIRPITGPLSAAEREPDPEPAPEPAPEPEPEPEPAGVPLETLEASPASRRRSSWPLFAGLGLLCGAAVVFGIPQVREKVLGSGPASEAPPDVSAAGLADLDAAVQLGTLAALRDALAQADPGGEGVSATARADLALARAEAKAAESVSLQLQALHASDDSDASFRAADAADAAAQAFAGVDVDRATPARLARARARVRLAQGRPEDEVLPLVPADQPELRAMVLGAQLWLDARARVPTGLITTLEALEHPSVPAKVLLATAYARGGDEVGARTVRDALAADAAQDATVVALLSSASSQAVVAEARESGTPADSGDSPEPDDGSEETVVVEDDDAPKGMSIDKLISRGCDQVERGDTASGQKLLLKAFDRRPNDLDVLVCLGTANRKKGISTTALRYYERALDRSPRFMPALLGAARSATKLGQNEKALGYYRRVVAVSPSDAEAKSFIAKQSASSKKPTPPSGGSDGEPETPTPPGSSDRKPEPPKPSGEPARKPEPPTASPE